MDNILKLNQLIEAVLNDNVSGLSLVTEENRNNSAESIGGYPCCTLSKTTTECQMGSQSFWRSRCRTV